MCTFRYTHASYCTWCRTASHIYFFFKIYIPLVYYYEGTHTFICGHIIYEFIVVQLYVVIVMYVYQSVRVHTPLLWYSSAFLTTSSFTSIHINISLCQRRCSCNHSAPLLPYAPASMIHRFSRIEITRVVFFLLQVYTCVQFYYTEEGVVCGARVHTSIF